MIMYVQHKPGLRRASSPCFGLPSTSVPKGPSTHLFTFYSEAKRQEATPGFPCVVCC